MRHSRARIIVILLGTSAVAAALSFALAIRGDQIAAATHQIPLKLTLTTFQDANRENSTNPLAHNSPSLIAKEVMRVQPFFFQLSVTNGNRNCTIVN